MSERTQFRDLASPETLRKRLAAFDLTGDTTAVALEDAAGRVLAERVDADLDVPGFDRAAMDGYAVRAEDVVGASETDPVSLTVAGRLEAGQTPATAVEGRTAVEVATGAVLPECANAVVVVEATTAVDGSVEVRSAVAPGANVMASGADVAAGDRALGPGTRLTHREVGLLAALGRERVAVRTGPTVGVVSTGAELVSPGDSLDHAAGEIHDVNGHAVAAAVSATGATPRQYPTVPDDAAEMATVLADAADDCDLVVTSGSTSAGAGDRVHRVVAERGEVVIHGVAVKPGKPTVVGRVDGVPFVGLPGYPVSALSVFRAFLAPVLARAAGRSDPPSATLDAEMAVRERFEEARLRLLPVGVVEDGEGSRLAYPVDRGSGATTSLVDADGVVEVAAGVDYVSPGESVEVALFSPDVRPPRLLAVGERDPLLAELFDAVREPRFLPRGSRAGARWLADGVADVATVAGPHAADDAVPGDARELGTWSREWGLVVPAGDPNDVDGLAALLDADLQFANRHAGSGLRASFEAALDRLAAERGLDAGTVRERVDGYGLETRGLESPARRVADGRADAGLGLRATAERLALGFVPLGSEPVRLLAAADRREKVGVTELEAALERCEDAVEDLAGVAVED